MMLDVYIAFLTGAVDEDGYPKLVENPTPPTQRQSPFFRNGYRSFIELKHRINAGVYEGWAIDWGSWGAVVKKRQILDFIGDMGAGSYELDAFLAKLDDETDYVMVASEI